jgi:Flp pilus assembly protein TadG
MPQMPNLFMFIAAHQSRRVFGRLLQSDRGVAAIEFSLIMSFAVIGCLNVADLAVYARDRLEVENSAAMGAEAAIKTCTLNQVPATTNCPGLNSAVTAAIQSTGLGSQISLASGSPSEAYYCVNSSNVLTYVSSVSSKPSNCSSVSMPNNYPGDYIEVQTSFAYVPLFPGLTVTGAFPGTITKTSWMRLD